MQDPSLYSQIKPPQVQPPQQQAQQFPEHEHLKCPRCDSPNTKFCYYNNYNLSQPRHYCKGCRRYWTKGGTLRNIPIGGGSRKNAKRSSPVSSAAAAKRPASTPPAIEEKVVNDESKSDEGEVTDKMPLPKGGDNNFEGQFGNLMEAGGSFSSLLGSTGGHFGNFIDGSSDLQMGGHYGEPGAGQNMDPGSGGSNNADGFLNGGWSGGSNGWPDLSMYTPGSTYL